MDALLRTPLLRALPGAERLLPHLEPLTRGPGEVIVREGACDRDLYLLLEGHARILIGRATRLNSSHIALARMPSSA